MPTVRSTLDLDEADSSPPPREPPKSAEQLFEEAVNDALVKLTRPGEHGLPRLTASETYMLSYVVVRSLHRLGDEMRGDSAAHEAFAKADHHAMQAWAWLQKLAQLEEKR